MKKFFLLSLLVLAAGEGLYAAPAAAGRDVPGDSPDAVDFRPPCDPHARALEYYITGLLQSEPAARVGFLRRAVLLDPRNRLPLAVLTKTLSRAPELAKETAQALNGVRAQYRKDIFFAHQLAVIDALAETKPEKILAEIAPLLRRKPEKKELESFRALAAFWVDQQLKIPGPAVEPPFGPDDLRLIECTLLYYGTSGLRDQLSARDSVAESGMARCLARLRAMELTRPADVRRILAVLTAVRRNDEAFGIAKKWRSGNPVAELLFIEAASRAGKAAELESALKKHPSLTVDFCAKMRFVCFLEANDFARAEGELANFKEPAERLTSALRLAQVTRDAGKMRKVIARMQALTKRDPVTLAMAWLSLAELTGDREALSTGLALISGPRFAADPILANAAGYVSAALGVDLELAETRIKFALSRRPENPAYLDSMAWVKFKRGAYAEAADYMDRAIARTTADLGGAVIADHAGDIDLALGKKERALRRFKTALGLYEKNRVENADLDPVTLRKKIAALEKSLRK